ncbi:MAG: methyltransferase [Roseibium sp.]
MSDQVDTDDTAGMAATRQPVAGPSTTGGQQHMGLRLRQWRNSLIGSQGFRSRALRFPGARWLAKRKANGLFRLTAGFVFSQVLSACVSLGVLDRLRHARLSTEELAKECGLPEDRMQLLLEQAERLDLVRRAGRSCWILDDFGVVVASDPGLTAMITHHSLLYRDLDQPAKLFKSSKRPTRLKKYWAYAHGQNPSGVNAETAQSYSALMRSSQAMMADCILAAHDFGHYASILDAGGGDGAFLAAAAAEYPGLQLQLFDLPPVIELAREHLTEKYLIDRSKLHAGDFTKDPLPDTADCVCLIRVLCDHDDARVLDILGNLHRSLKPGTRIMIAEAMAGQSEGARLAAVYFSLYFLAMGSGRCRTDMEIKGLLEKAGFRRPHTVESPNPLLATLVFAER